MRILIVTAELAPIAAAGGVAQYTMGLARALSQNQHEVHVAIPNYGFLPTTHPEPLDGITVHSLSDNPHFRGLSSVLGIYKTRDFSPWVDFCKATVEFLRYSEWLPDVIHCQDGHTSLIPVYIGAERQMTPSAFGSTRTMITIHNLLEQGRGPREFFNTLDLQPDLFESHFEFYGGTNCYKAGLMFADRVSTVSRTYAREIVSSEDFGFGLSGVLKSLTDPPVGIVNGIDLDTWMLPGTSYDGSTQIDAIIKEKRSILSTLLPTWVQKYHDPIVAFKARWDRQKGIELLTESMEEILEHARFIFDTWGEPKDNSGSYYETWKALSSLRDKYPLRLAINVPGTTSAEESNALYTVADFLIMPSVYEPCGLAQMECQRYGCIPIVRRTGGLADTVIDLSTGSASNGVVFNTMTPKGILSALKRAVKAHANAQVMGDLIKEAISQQNGWHDRVPEYEVLYKDADH